MAFVSGGLLSSAPPALAGGISAAAAEYSWISPLPQPAVHVSPPARPRPVAVAAGARLPFTDLSLLVPAAVSACLVGGGVALRRRRAPRI